MRVLFLGDSRTFGIWWDGERYRFDAYPAAFERQAQAGGARGSVAVYNAGTVGYSAAKGLRQWAVRLGDLAPDVVVAAFGLNDHAAAWNPACALREPRSRLARAALRAAAATRWGEGMLFAWRRALFHRNDVARLSETERVVLADVGRSRLRPWHSVDEYARHVELLAAEARARRVNLLFVHIPLRPLELGENRPPAPDPGLYYAMLGARDLADLHGLNARYRDALLAVAARERVPVLDLEAAFRASLGDGPDRALFSDSDLVHPNERGAGVVAAAVLGRLRELRWLEPAGSRSVDRAPRVEDRAKRGRRLRVS